MDNVLVGLGAAWFVLLLFFGLLVVLMPVFIYLCQRYLFDIRHEVRGINDSVVSLTDTVAVLAQQQSREQVRPPTS